MVAWECTQTFVLVSLAMDDWVTQLIDVEPIDYAAIISLCGTSVRVGAL